MSTTHERSGESDALNTASDFGLEAPAGDDPSRGREVWAPVEGPFEKPAETIEQGPLFRDVDERMPELSESSDTLAQKKPQPIVAGVSAKADKDGFSVDRRDFMKLFSAASMAATAACVERPLEKAIPYVQQPVDQWPGEPVYYATTCGACSGGCGVMVKTREGRPTKLEGLPEHPVSKGKLCATAQGSIQGLFHPERPRGPRIKFGQGFDKVSWTDAFEHLGSKVGKTTKIGILTNGSTGNRNAFFREFLERMGAPATNLWTIDSNTLGDAVTAAHKLVYGVNAMPRADLDQARVIVGIGADFLDIGLSLVYNSAGYTSSHAFKAGVRGKHVQLESGFTLTGAKADERFIIAPGSETLATLLLARSLLENKSSKGSSAARTQIQQVLEQKAGLIGGGYDRVGVKREDFDRIAAELLAEPSIVMCGSSYAFDENATNLQLAAIMVNELIGAYDTTLHLAKGWMVPPVQVGDLTRFFAEAPACDILFVVDVDPIFTIPATFGVKELLAKIPTLVSIQDFPNEVDEMAQYSLNGNHYLESWGDEQPVAGFWTMRQPTVRATYDSRQAEEIMMWIAATLKKPLGYESYRDYLAKKWQAVHQLTGSQLDFDRFFSGVIQRGYVNTGATQAVSSFSSSLAASFKYVDTGASGLRLIAPLNNLIRDGKFAHLPVLQETADSMTTVTWDSVVLLNPATASKLGLKRADVVKVQGPAGSFEAPVYPMPGIHADAVIVSRGNGHKQSASIVSGGNGVDPLVALAKGTDAVTGAPVTTGQSVKLTATGAIFPIAYTNKTGDLGNRTDIVKKHSLASAKANVGKKVDLDTVPNLYPALPKAEYRWGMSIDLDRCSGCGACTVACNIENNIPQVGRLQVMYGREMHWIKIDRYFSGPTDNPQVTFQPMLCQHCNHAPCEAVCPVFATQHDPEGFNAMTYNRCVGTRYCANACPYKIRRFNWFTHRWGETAGDSLAQDRSPPPMNPDVTVRTRGVMEKCSFCYQRVRDQKHRVKVRGTPLKDGEIKTACQQTCPTEAINFGNLFDAESMATNLRTDARAYLALGGDPAHGHYNLKTLPNVSYLAQVTLKEPPAPGHGSGGGSEHGGGAEHHG